MKNQNNYKIIYVFMITIILFTLFYYFYGKTFENFYIGAGSASVNAGYQNSASSPGKPSTGGCFPNESFIYLEKDRKTYISEVNVGDKIH